MFPVADGALNGDNAVLSNRSCTCRALRVYSRRNRGIATFPRLRGLKDSYS